MTSTSSRFAYSPRRRQTQQRLILKKRPSSSNISGFLQSFIRFFCMSHVPAPPSLLSQRKDTTSISFLDENEHCLRGGGKACGAKRHPKEVTVPSDGLCLFHSIALFFGSRETDTNTLKRRALDIRVKTREFLTKCPRAGNARAVADEITRLSIPSWRGNYPRESWPGEVTLQAISTLFKVNISTFCLHKGSLVLTARFHKVLGEGEVSENLLSDEVIVIKAGV